MMELNVAIRERVFAAADSLYEASDRSTFPTVDAVRRQAKVNMNDACAGMKEWRRQQSPPVAMVPGDVPPALRQAALASMQAMWHQATAMANEALQAAQTAWQAERAECELLTEQMGAAFDSQTRDLEAARTELAALQAQRAELAEQLGAAQQRTEQLTFDSIILGASVERANAIVTEMEKRATQQQQELERSHAALDAARGELGEMHQAHAREIREIHATQEEARRAAGETETALHTQLAQTREEAAVLRGTLAALDQTNNRKRQRASATNASLHQAPRPTGDPSSQQG